MTQKFLVGEKGLSQICDASQTLARLVTERDEASGPHGTPCTPWQKDSAVAQGLVSAHCQGKNNWKSSTQKWDVEVWVKLNTLKCYSARLQKMLSTNFPKYIIHRSHKVISPLYIKVLNFFNIYLFLPDTSFQCSPINLKHPNA